MQLLVQSQRSSPRNGITISRRVGSVGAVLHGGTKNVPKLSTITPPPDGRRTTRNSEKPQKRPNASSSVIKSRRSRKLENAPGTLWNGSNRGRTLLAKPSSQTEGHVIICLHCLMHCTTLTTLPLAGNVIIIFSRTSQKWRRGLGPSYQRRK